MCWCVLTVGCLLDAPLSITCMFPFFFSSVYSSRVSSVSNEKFDGLGLLTSRLAGALLH